MHHPLIKLDANRHLSNPRLPLSSQSASNIRNGIRKPPPSNSPHLILVLPLPRQLRLDRHLRQPPPRHGALPRRSRLLPRPPLRIPLGPKRQCQKRRLPQLRPRISRVIHRPPESYALETQTRRPRRPSNSASATPTAHPPHSASGR